MPQPNLSYLKNTMVAVAGIPAGVLTGVTGQSSAPFLQPFIDWLLGINGSSLNGVALAAVSFSSWSALLAFGQSGNVSWLSGAMILLGTLFGTTLAAISVRKSPSFFIRVRSLWSFLPLMLAIIMIVSVFEPGATTQLKVFVLPHSSAIITQFWCVIIGIAVGFVGQTGDLGSILIVPLLLMLLQDSLLLAEGTALFVLFLASFPAFLLHAFKGQIEPNAAMALSFGAVFGSLFGSHIVVTGMGTSQMIVLCGLTIAAISLSKLFQSPPTPSTKIDE
jgi:uncharacterized membrane protein YfcA